MKRALPILAAAFALGSCGREVERIDLPEDTETRAAYIDEGLLPASLPSTASIEFIERAGAAGEFVVIGFHLSDEDDLTWLNGLREPAAYNPVEQSGQTGAREGVLAFGDICDTGTAWRYVVTEAGAGQVQRLAQDAAVCDEL